MVVLNMARRKNFIAIDGNAFAEYAEKLDRLGADLHQIFGDSLLKAAEKVQADTHSAIAPGNLPRQGKYSNGDTGTAILDARVEWSGEVCEAPLGFDKTKPGAGGWLITGTPKMAPDAALATMYTGKAYERNINKQIKEDLQRAIDERMGG